MKQPQEGLAIEKWDWQRKREVKHWLLDNFGEGGTGLPLETNRWGEHYDYGLENLYMDQDVYSLYKLKFG
jgi:hypothetical protein